MTKNKTLFVVLFIFLSVTVYFVIRQSGSTIKEELKDFAVKDTASITKIFIADRNGNSITLEREKNGVWKLENKYIPKSDFLKLLLDCIYKIDVKNRVSKAAYNNVVKELASTGIKCEIYLDSEKKPFKTYYVGGQTEDALGTFMILENSSLPFITEVPGFNGYLTPRYSVSLDAWRQTSLFQFALGEIKSVSVKYTNYPEKSFSIQSSNGSYHVTSLADKKILKNTDSVSIENYLSFYTNVFFENWDREMSEWRNDTLLKFPPSITVSVTDNNNYLKEVDIYPMPVSSASLTKEDNTGKPLQYDVDRMYGYVRPEKEFVIIQHYTFDKLLRQLSDFDGNRPK